MPDQMNPEATVRDLVVKRVMKATPELIWSAFTDPEQIVKFFGPVGTTIALETVTIDPRDGGEFSLVMSLNDSDTEFPMNATYLEFIENEKMVFETEGGIVGTIELTDLGNGETELTWTTRTAFDDELWENAKVGTNSAADQLVEHIAAIQA